MEDKVIYDLIDRFENSKLTIMKIEKEDLKLHLEKGGIVTTSPQATIESPVQITLPANDNAKLDDNSYEKVNSPIVGVFYEAASPSDPPYVSVGEKVKKDQVLCLVEAMKMMNELKSPVDGIIKAIHGKNGELVEYNQTLFEVEKC